ncbi:MAG: hypothetical protein A2X46_05135 [Lentisphaerae bacterium GWF2_57_35]|nr:MAG: hypothetical protein A2X46_05135 [Lentisphaerae bacterium GWF2_57_35]
MNILLTTRKAFEEQRNPIGLLDLASYLRAFGHDVDVFYLHQLRHGVVRGKYDIVGLSVLQSDDPCRPIMDAQRLRKIFKTRVVVGGKWAQDMPEELEQSFGKAGIELCKGEGELFFQHQPIDFIRYPVWAQKDFATLREVHGEIMTMRGCPFRCHFCHNTERTIHHFSADRTVANVKLLTQLGQKKFFIVDDIFAAAAHRMEELYERLESEDLQISNAFTFFAHIQCLNDLTIECIRKYQPACVHIGIESGDDGMLKRMGKTFTSSQASEKLKVLSEMGISIAGLFIIGFPYETVESMENTLQFIRHNKSYMNSVWVSYYQPVFGTVGYQYAKQRVSQAKVGFRNTQISYVDPNLTKRLLSLYRYDMMEAYSLNKRWVKTLQRLMLTFMPYRAVENAQFLKKTLFSLLRRLHAIE